MSKGPSRLRRTLVITTGLILCSIVGCLAAIVLSPGRQSSNEDTRAQDVAKLPEATSPSNTPIPPTAAPIPTRQPTSTPSPTASDTATPTDTLIPRTATAIARVSQVAATAAARTATAISRVSATALAKSQALATSTARAATKVAANATATLEAFATKMPKGTWIAQEGGIGVAVGDFRYLKYASYSYAGEGAKFVAFAIAIVNKSGSTISVNPYNVTLVDTKGIAYQFDSTTYGYWSIPLQGVEVADGQRAEGGLVFVIREDTAPAQITFETGGLIFTTKVTVDVHRLPDER